MYKSTILHLRFTKQQKNPLKLLKGYYVPVPMVCILKNTVFNRFNGCFKAFTAR
jgi:hypothetical protein